MSQLAPRAAVKRMLPYHPPLGDRSGLRLDFNENTLACSPRVREALGAISTADLTRYPERGPIEAMVARHHGLLPEQVLLTNGVDEAIHVLCQTYLDPGERMLFSVPTYTMYDVYGSGADATLDRVMAGADFSFPLEAMLAAIRPETRLIAVANPNSPTGQTVKREQLLALIAAAPHAAVLVDEAYFHFFGESVMDLVGQVPNLIVARTFSKAYGLAGLRLGMLAASAEQMEWMRRVISPYSVNTLALACLPPALADQSYLNWYVEEVRQARTELEQALDRLGLARWPSEANFVLVRVGDKHREFTQALRARRVLVRDRSADPGCAGCVRITVGTREQTRAAVQAIEESLNVISWKAER